MNAYAPRTPLALASRRLRRALADATPATPPLPAALKPAAYLRLRRKAAGLTVPQLADRITGVPADRDDRDEMMCLIALLETDGSVARRDATIAAIARAMPMDADVYRQLRDDPVEQHPRTCRDCGCSAWDRCGADQRAGHVDCCTWESETQCTRCAGTTGSVIQ